MQPIVVQKYGGSSVADTQRIRKVAERIADTPAQGKQVCVVVSAMGTTTNELLAKAREISPAPSRRELDMLLSCGERAAMALLSMAVHELGYEAVSLTGSQSGIITNDRHSGARIIEVRPVRVQDELERGRVVIVAGFQGVSYKREITTLGRGGSDTTAVALAAALGAECCEICSDVDGVYSADPRLVGAAELHAPPSRTTRCWSWRRTAPRCCTPRRSSWRAASQIALYARATSRRRRGDAHRRAGGGGARAPGRRRDRAEEPGPPARARRRRDRGAPGAGARRAAADAGAGGAEPDRAELLLALDDVPDWPRCASGRARSSPDWSCEEGLGAVSVVGDFIGRDAERGRARAPGGGRGRRRRSRAIVDLAAARDAVCAARRRSTGWCRCSTGCCARRREPAGCRCSTATAGPARTRSRTRMGAFARARADGADGVELDVRLAADGELVVFHDEDLPRIAGRPGAGRGARPGASWRAVRAAGRRAHPAPRRGAGRDWRRSWSTSRSSRPAGAGLRDGGARGGRVRRARPAPRDRVLVSSFDLAAVGAGPARRRRSARGLLFHARQRRPLRRAWLAPLIRPHALHPERVLVDAAAMARWRRPATPSTCGRWTIRPSCAAWPRSASMASSPTIPAAARAALSA